MPPDKTTPDLGELGKALLEHLSKSRDIKSPDIRKQFSELNSEFIKLFKPTERLSRAAQTLQKSFTALSTALAVNKSAFNDLYRTHGRNLDTLYQIIKAYKRQISYNKLLGDETSETIKEIEKLYKKFQKEFEKLKIDERAEDLIDSFSELSDLASATAEDFLLMGKRNIDIELIKSFKSSEQLSKALESLRSGVMSLGDALLYDKDAFKELYDSYSDNIEVLKTVIETYKDTIIQQQLLGSETKSVVEFLTKSIETLGKEYDKIKLNDKIQDLHSNISELKDKTDELSKTNNFFLRTLNAVGIDTKRVSDHFKNIQNFAFKLSYNLGITTDEFEAFNKEQHQYIPINEKASKTTRTFIENINRAIHTLRIYHNVIMNVYEGLFHEFSELKSEIILTFSDIVEPVKKATDFVQSEIADLQRELAVLGIDTIGLVRESFVDLSETILTAVAFAGDLRYGTEELAKSYIELKKTLVLLNTTFDKGITKSILNYSNITGYSSQQTAIFVKQFRDLYGTTNNLEDSFRNLANIIDKDLARNITEMVENVVILARIPPRNIENFTRNISALANAFTRLGVSSSTIQNLIESLTSPDITQVPAIFADVAFSLQRTGNMDQLINRFATFADLLKGAGPFAGTLAESLGISADLARVLVSTSKEELLTMIETSKQMKSMEEITANASKNMQVFNNFVSAMKSTLAGIFATFKAEAFTKLLFGTDDPKEVQRIFNNFISAFSNFVNVFKKSISGISNFVSDLFGEGLLVKLTEIFSGAKAENVLSKLGDAFIEIGSDIVSGLVVFFVRLLNNLPEYILKFTLFIFKFWWKVVVKVWKKLSWKDLLTTAVNLILLIFSGGIGNILSRFGGVIAKGLTRFLPRFLPTIFKIFSKAFGVLVKVFNFIWKIISPIFGFIVKAISKLVGMFGKPIDLVVKMISFIKLLGKNVINFYKNIFKFFFVDKIMEFVGKVGDFFKNIFKLFSVDKIIGFIGDVIKFIWDKIVAFIKMLIPAWLFNMIFGAKAEAKEAVAPEKAEVKVEASRPKPIITPETEQLQTLNQIVEYSQKTSDKLDTLIEEIRSLRDGFTEIARAIKANKPFLPVAR